MRRRLLFDVAEIVCVTLPLSIIWFSDYTLKQIERFRKTQFSFYCFRSDEMKGSCVISIERPLRRVASFHCVTKAVDLELGDTVIHWVFRHFALLSLKFLLNTWTIPTIPFRRAHLIKGILLPFFFSIIVMNEFLSKEDEESNLVEGIKSIKTTEPLKDFEINSRKNSKGGRRGEVIKSKM